MSWIKPHGTLIHGLLDACKQASSNPWLILSETAIDDLTLWLAAFDDNLTLTQNDNISNERKRTLLLAVGGLELRKVINSLTLADNKYQALSSGLKHYLQPIVKVLIEQHWFFLRWNEI